MQLPAVEMAWRIQTDENKLDLSQKAMKQYHDWQLGGPTTFGHTGTNTSQELLGR